MNDFAKFNGEADLGRLIGPLGKIQETVNSRFGTGRKNTLLFAAVPMWINFDATGFNRLSPTAGTGFLRFGFNRDVKILAVNMNLKFVGRAAYYTGANLFPVFDYTTEAILYRTNGLAYRDSRFVSSGVFNAGNPRLSQEGRVMATKSANFVDLANLGIYADGIGSFFSSIEAVNALPAPDPVAPASGTYSFDLYLTVIVDPNDYA